jgi:flagellar protein FlaG
MLLSSLTGLASPGTEAAGGSAVGNRAPAVQRAVQPSSEGIQTDPPAPVDRAELQKAVLHAQEAVREKASNLQFVLDDETGKTIVKVVDSQTNQVIRQIPSEEMLAISRNVARIQGLLLKHKA